MSARATVLSLSLFFVLNPRSLTGLIHQGKLHQKRIVSLAKKCPPIRALGFMACWASDAVIRKCATAVRILNSTLPFFIIPTQIPFKYLAYFVLFRALATSL